MAAQIFQKVLFILISLVIQTSISQPPTVLFPRSKFQSKTQNLHTSFQLKIIVFFSSIGILIVRKIERKNFNFNFLRCSKSFFARTTGFIFSIMDSTETVLDVERFSMRELLICAPRISAFTVWNFQEVFFLFRSNYKICNPQPLQNRFSPSGTLF